MKYELEELQEANLFSLRNLAREIGVKNPTMLNKKDLIEEIMKIDSGEVQPCERTNRGHPIKKDIEIKSDMSVDPVLKELKKRFKKEFIASILKEIEDKLNKIL